MDLTQVIEELDRIFPRLGGKNKIRIVYDVSQYRPNTLLIITTDAISAFDFVMLNDIPGKGIVLSEISAWWFNATSHICQNHFLTDILDHNVPLPLAELLAPYRDVLKGRMMLVRKAKPLPAEFIVRRYLLGSAWESYKETGMVCGIRLKKGLKKGDRLDRLIFTPSTKASFGEHDVNITYKELQRLIGVKLAREVKKQSLALFEYAEQVALKKGLTLQDTKFEFGLLPDGTLILIDELFTPDNSRWTPDHTKQPFRDALLRLGYEKRGPINIGIPLIRETQRNYAQALLIITGKTLEI
ncbi:MAG TPA: phosphoribosylaminoimidazolesuccinocarboxamide synthase [Candidatus Paceibacterota bacterium]|nr:phosphoribosylaminoimidazolesuccinocarboxamide synthase [Candidatus Pacearchaeota archaeon]HRZ50779.1 phosphoribosylaminoimidazolesuccinocarboxamide synthase [Candidatus Paceibacterota bacterium]HSA36324.1 phosphoribosylaminoimidazolesuccinocarboxamide synthase [Candidatus Paceibacterota bacterium]